MKFYIKERDNPQFKKPYYVALGALPKKEAIKKSRSLYGANTIHKFDTKEEYEKALDDLRLKGYNIHQH